MAVKPKPFRRDSVSLSTPAGPKREWKHIHPALLTEGDIVAERGKIERAQTTVERLLDPHGWRIGTVIRFASGESIGYPDLIHDWDTLNADIDYDDPYGILAVSALTVHAFTTAAPRG